MSIATSTSSRIGDSIGNSMCVVIAMNNYISGDIISVVTNSICISVRFSPAQAVFFSRLHRHYSAWGSSRRFVN